MRLDLTRSLVLMTLLVLGVSAWGSTNGSISGIVTSPTGAVVVVAQAVATEIQAQARTELVTDAKGSLNIPTLPIGNYTLEIHAKSLNTYKKRGCSLTPTLLYA